MFTLPRSLCCELLFSLYFRWFESLRLIPTCWSATDFRFQASLEYLIHQKLNKCIRLDSLKRRLFSSGVCGPKRRVTIRIYRLQGNGDACYCGSRCLLKTVFLRYLRSRVGQSHLRPGVSHQNLWNPPCSGECCQCQPPPSIHPSVRQSINTLCSRWGVSSCFSRWLSGHFVTIT